MLKHRTRTLAWLVAATWVIISVLGLPAMAQQKADTRDEFFWLGQINADFAKLLKGAKQ